METDAHLRDLLARLLAWEDAHVTFDAAVAGIAVAHRGATPKGLPHSPWQLVEHLRRAQHDIFEFCVNPDYEEQRWPDDYWPPSPAPPSDAAWDESIDAVRRDRAALQQLVLRLVEFLRGRGLGRTLALNRHHLGGLLVDLDGR